jgi:hypothetical protein
MMTSVNSRSNESPLDNRQRLGAAPHRDGLIAEALDLGGHRSADQRVVLHHQNGLHAAFDQRRGGRFDDRLRRARARQIKLDARALSLLAVHVDLPAGLLDESVYHAQPEAGALADALGREEWIEDLVADGRRNAGAGIAHRDHHILARRNLGMRAGVRFIEHDIAGFERELSALGHGIA